MATVDILIPTYNRPSALAITIASLISQTCRDFHLIISDQTEDFDAGSIAEVQSVLRVLRSHHHRSKFTSIYRVRAWQSIASFS
ncbi:MAG: glycosyltransferase [Phormidesmis sp. CAN_BIN44]|nr:glycosyltransferase [Phormidesmis sp. CAN_BIN44]